MELEPKKILILNLGKINNLVTYDEKKLLEQSRLVITQLQVDNIELAQVEFLKSKYDFLVTVNLDRWLNKSLEIDTYLIRCVEFLTDNEHYAICQPSILYGKISEEHKNFSAQTRKFSHISFIDDVFLVFKGSVVRNFKFNSFIQNNKIDWHVYNAEINMYGFESCRLYSCYLEAILEEGIRLNPVPNDFVDLLNQSYLRKNYNIGIELSFLEPIYNGTSEYAISLLTEMVEILSQRNISFQIIADVRVIEKFHLEKFADHTIESSRMEENFYKLLFVPQQIFSLSSLEKVNRNCFQYVFTMLDVIALRCRYLGPPLIFDSVGSLSYKYSDNVLGLSKNASLDIESFFTERMIYKKVTPVLLTKEILQDEIKDDPQFLEKDYILLIGNGFKHKAIEKTLTELFETNLNIIVIGNEHLSEKFKDRFKFYTSGMISNETMDLLYQNSSLILYPSFYEGFGLPVIASLQLGKRVLVYDTPVNRELKKEFDKNDLIYFFETFSDLGIIIQNIIANSTYDKSKLQIDRTWKDVSKETTTILLSTLKQPLDFDKVNQRVYDIKEMRRILDFAPSERLYHLSFLLKMVRDILIRKMNWYLARLRNSLKFW